jgi:hypothetical protein
MSISGSIAGWPAAAQPKLPGRSNGVDIKDPSDMTYLGARSDVGD